MKYSTPRCSRYIAVILLAMFTARLNAQSISVWREADPHLVLNSNRYSIPVSFRTVALDISEMKIALSSAPHEFTDAARSNTATISLPMPDGSMAAFRVFETNVLAPGLAAHYPQIKTYVAQGITDKYAYARLDVTDFGFHAMILSPQGDVFIDPVSNDNNELYISYFKKDLPRHDDFVCGVNDDDVVAFNAERKYRDYANRSNGEELRTYRLALACTGEYATKKGGTVSGALSGMTTSINRVTGVYEQELAIRMEIIENDTLLIYLNSSTDPYSNNDGGAMLDQNQTTVNSVIGSANYDIGHVFSTGGGGIAMLGCVCRNSLKAQGVTGLPNPVGDAFDIDYVAHEMGHQFGANHTFNCTSGSCAGNRNSGTAFEPGSGSTIMAYAGICGSTNDLQSHSDPFFHTGSVDEILDYVIFDFGADCPVITETDNAAPELVVGGGFSIPKSTPFRLEASGTDPEGEPLTYMWEEVDHGPAGNWNDPSGQAPCFRSWSEDTVGFRYFPKMGTIVNNYPTSAKGEVLPDYNRSLNFRFIARDHHLNGGGYAYEDNEVGLSVVGAAGPFVVTFPNSDINWPINTQQLVTWDVSGTDLAPISCTQVDILLSTDGGYTYPITLATAVPNQGFANVMMPNDNSLVGNDEARVMVRATANVFFDISNANFTITNNVGISNLNNLSGYMNVFPNPVSDLVTVELKGLDHEFVTLQIRDAIGRLVEQTTADQQSGNVTFQFDIHDASSGVYFIEATTDAGMGVKKIVKE